MTLQIAALDPTTPGHEAAALSLDHTALSRAE